MLENKFAETFEEYKVERYQKLELDFLKKTAAVLSKNFSSIRKNFLKNLQDAISEAIKFQQEEKFSCAYISVSFLNTSMFENKPVFQIDFYDEGWVYEKSFFRKKFPADFLLEHWQKFIADALDDSFFVRSKISKVEIKSLFWATLDKVIYLFTCQTKYFAFQISYSNELDDLQKAENFYITCGTYLDWQERIFAILPEIDLLNPDANEETNFRPVREKIFRKKSFHDLDMRNCYFLDCLFDEFDFENLNLSDALFLRCRFKNTKFINSKFAGTNFWECNFKDCEFQNCSSNPASVNDDEYFANFRMYHCYIFNIKFSDCDFENLQKINCFEK